MFDLVSAIELVLVLGSGHTYRRESSSGLLMPRSPWIARSAARAWPAFIRLPGSLARSPSMTGRSGPARRNGAGASLAIAASVVSSESPSKGGLPSTPANKVAPSE